MFTVNRVRCRVCGREMPRRCYPSRISPSDHMFISTLLFLPVARLFLKGADVLSDEMAVLFIGLAMLPFSWGLYLHLFGRIEDVCPECLVATVSGHPGSSTSSTVE